MSVDFLEIANFNMRVEFNDNDSILLSIFMRDFTNVRRCKEKLQFDILNFILGPAIDTIFITFFLSLMNLSRKNMQDHHLNRREFSKE